MTGAPISITFAGKQMSPAQWLACLGIAHYGPNRLNLPVGVRSAGWEFDDLVGLARQRGFTERRQLISNLRTGKVGPKALARCEAVMALIEPAELSHKLDWLNFRARVGA